MFERMMSVCASLLLTVVAALGAEQGDAKSAPWAGSYQDRQVTLNLKARPGGGYEGMIFFQGESFPLTASGGADQLSGSFQSGDGRFAFTLARDGESVNLATGGKTYHLSRQGANPLGVQSSAANPLAAPAAPPAQGTSVTASGDAPKGYRVAVATDTGKKLLAHKADAKSLQLALTGALQDLSRWFDATPLAKGGFADAKDKRRGGAPFTATLKGQPVKGLISCVIGEQGADIAVTYCRANAPASEWAKLTADANSAATAPPAGVPMHEYDFPDGTGSIQLPEGWKTSAQTTIHGVRVEGPAEQTVSLGINFTVMTADSFIVKNQIQMAAQARQMGLPPPKPLEMLVAPYTEPVTALKNLVPQLSQLSQRHGGPGITLDKMLEAPKPAQAVFANGRAATLYYAFTKITGGTPAPFRARGQYESWMLGQGSWYLYVSEAAGPDATFDKDWPVMLAIATSLKTDPQAVQRATSRAIDAQNQNFQAMQRAHATQQAAFDDYFKSMQRNSVIRERSAIDFDEVIRGVRTVEDTQTGYRTSVDLGNVNEIVDKLNEHDPGRYIQIPLRDEMAPLPPESNR